tara:strand:+ start:273 stop:1544 length:1272 start_codon:yes stop_codon:yes gene_type:complete
MNIEDYCIKVIGLGYVGLPLAVELSKKFDVIGYDINKDRVENLINGIDETREVSSEDLNACKNLIFTNDLRAEDKKSFYIVTVPTPVDKDNKPDLTPIISATKEIASVISKGDIVVYESTVFPGCTEEVCVKIIENNTNFSLNEDFFVGYSPERINPGDPSRRIKDIKKITSGSTKEVAEFIDKVYSSIIEAGTYKASSIKVAEAAKVIENTQRDLNIALINELALIFNKLDIDTEEVLKAAETKWNFLSFRPGLVGGHCIGVDPYYLTHKAQEIDYNPEVILAGRRLNDSMSKYVAKQVISIMKSKKIEILGSNILVLGLTFKENCPDTRNSKVFDLIRSLETSKANVEVFDPWVNYEDKILDDINLVQEPNEDYYDAIVLAVAHEEFIKSGISKIRRLAKSKSVIYDVKSAFSKEEVDARL